MMQLRRDARLRAPNFGEDGAMLYPFFLDGVAADPKLNQKDGMHPTEPGVEAIVARMLPSVEALIAKAPR